MPLDISKSHSKIEINLSKPYHKGPLLIDLKSRSSKTLIDIKPIRKVKVSEITNQPTLQNPDIQEVNQKPKDIEQKTFSKGIKPPTLDFDMLEEFDDLLNPFSKIEYRDATDVKIKPNVEKSKKVENTDPVDTLKQVGDIKKPSAVLGSIFSANQKTKINVAPLHNKSRTLTTVDQNRSLVKNKKNTRSRFVGVVDGYASDLNNFKTDFQTEDFAKVNKDDFFQFKAPQKFDSSDIPQFASPTSQDFKITNAVVEASDLKNLNQEILKSNLRKKIRNNSKFKRYSASTLFTTIIIIFCTLFLTGNAQWMGKFGEKNVQADKTKNQKIENYDKWIIGSNIDKYSPPGDDIDNDGLNNYEEFLIGSNPINKNTCNPAVDDNQNLINLVDPANCLPIDFSVQGQLQKFKDILNITPELEQKYQNQGIQNQAIEIPLVIKSLISVSQSSAAIVTDIVPLPSIETSPPTKPTFIEVSAEIKAPKIITENQIASIPFVESKKVEVEKVETIEPKSSVNAASVQQYIDQYRSYDKYDNQIANPVNADYFINMSEKYGVPLRYTLALARSESRFGTDQFNQDGSGNRIGRHLNMYSIGLDDDGGSITYPSWEAGVDAFGRWYTKFENQGYSDCAKWRIYNPNGDYCQKIENLANQIQNYIAN
jgi:Mannosyl-glycoprotein endo-beta-N-acetylglucosaminidase